MGLVGAASEGKGHLAPDVSSSIFQKKVETEILNFESAETNTTL